MSLLGSHAPEGEHASAPFTSEQHFGGSYGAQLG